MKNIKILDCTLRDGGYYNNWNFSRELIDEYLQAMAAINVDYVEFGFRSLKNIGFKGGCAFSTDDYINSFRIPEKLINNIGVMVNGSELLPGELNTEKTSANIEGYIHKVLALLFSSKNESPVTLVRIACHVHEFENCLLATSWLKNKGYTVGFNIMQIAVLSDTKISELAAMAEKYSVDVLYFADSMGSLTSEETSQIIKSLRKGWKGELGIHTHDNTGNALANSIRAVNDGVKWIDGTITGMGRGAGNVKTEYLVIALEEYRGAKAKITKLLELIDRHFKSLQNEFGWGSNPYYYYAGKYDIHPSYIQEMLADSRYNAEEVLVVLEHLKLEGARKFSIGALEIARNFYSGKPSGNWAPVDTIEGREVLILGSGPEIHSHLKAIESYINRYNPYVIALNTQQSIDETLIDIRSACHPVRLLADHQEHHKLPQPLVAPLKMLPQDVQLELQNKKIFDFGISIQAGVFEFHDMHCTLPAPLVIAYALAVATSGRSQRILLAGFDGYSADDPRRSEIDSIFSLYSKSDNSAPILSVTPTRYEIPEVSIYALESSE